jgi:type IV pilus biogenesis protein CpaD/CtpE
MKRIVVAILLLMLLTGCAKDESVVTSRFMTLETSRNWQIVADRDTGVMYVVSSGGYNRGTFTLLVDADGKPLIYDGSN